MHTHMHATPSSPFIYSLSFLSTCIPVSGVTRTVCLISVRWLVITQIKRARHSPGGDTRGRKNTQNWFPATSTTMEADKGVKFHRERSGLSWMWKKKPPVHSVWHCAANASEGKRRETNPSFTSTDRWSFLYSHGHSKHGAEFKVGGLGWPYSGTSCLEFDPSLACERLGAVEQLPCQQGWWWFVSEKSLQQQFLKMQNNMDGWRYYCISYLIRLVKKC